MQPDSFSWVSILVTSITSIISVGIGAWASYVLMNHKDKSDKKNKEKMTLQITLNKINILQCILNELKSRIPTYYESNAARIESNCLTDSGNLYKNKFMKKYNFLDDENKFKLLISYMECFDEIQDLIIKEQVFENFTLKTTIELFELIYDFNSIINNINDTLSERNNWVKVKYLDHLSSLEKNDSELTQDKFISSILPPLLSFNEHCHDRIHLAMNRINLLKDKIEKLSIF